jgi:hypothetical protein
MVGGMTCVNMKGPPCREGYFKFGIQLGYEKTHDSSPLSAIGVVFCAPLAFHPPTPTPHCPPLAP